MFIFSTYGFTSFKILERENCASLSSRVVYLSTNEESCYLDTFEETFAIEGKINDLDVLSDFGVIVIKLLEIIINFLRLS